MELPLYHVDAFTDRPFAGNPAAVCPLEAWPDDGLMQRIAAENNLSETAFIVRNGDGYRLRWFTPTVEVELCGHATLATAHVLLGSLTPEADEVRFQTLSGELVVRRSGDSLTMDFPALPPKDEAPPAAALAALPTPEAAYAIRSVHRADFLMAVYGSEAEVRDLKPDIRALGAAKANAIVTAPGDEVDFVSRFFAPASGIDEDPVTGSAHCTLTPYWAKRLGKSVLTARQVSARGGELICELRGERVLLTGRCVTVMEGRITL